MGREISAEAGDKDKYSSGAEAGSAERDDDVADGLPGCGTQVSGGFEEIVVEAVQVAE